MPDFSLPVTSELSSPCVYGTTSCSMLFRVFVMLPVVWARASSASIQMANIFCRPQNHDYDMAINVIILVIMSYTSVAPGRSVVSFLAAICLFVCLFFCGYIAFVLRSTTIPAVRITVRTLYSKLTCSYIYVSQLGRVGHTRYQVYIMLIQQSTGIVIRSMTSALSLRCTSS